MSNSENREEKLERLLRQAGDDLDHRYPVPSFWKAWLRTKIASVIDPRTLQATLMPVGAAAVVVSAVLIGQLIPSAGSGPLENARYVNTIDMTAFDDVWDSPTNSLLTMDTIGAKNERRRNGKQTDARGNGQTQ